MLNVPKLRARKDDLPTEFELKQIQICYEKRETVTELARRLNKPYRWILRVADRHGFSYPRYQRPNDWKPEEIKILEENLHCHPETIRRRLVKAGYKRTARAVRDKIRIHFGGFDNNPDVWNCEELCVLLGISSAVVKKWIYDGKLITTKSSTEFNIKKDEFKRFVFEYPHLLDYKKIPPSSWVWFLETITGRRLVFNGDS